ncbi:TBC domain-containing protein, putative [Eimeria tenella]|uniref:TBC domain-containing protein, putative n=1 Tax=Eimeria tenella TaxID=5802 RepID=U6KLM1_EIMTE|nr:TBC domain-containing protein, putative [Eimeria tenella]CDJ37726.1 TBC domain-containing protein, putative [Eimeria tenella]|eukprot:XP_013228564.1 TBC domain-containing protein, putative [Eimeria tenella]
MTASAHGLSDAAAVTAAGGGPPSSTTASFIGALHPSDDCLNRALRLWALVSPKATKRLVRLLTDGDRAACSRVCKTWRKALLSPPLLSAAFGRRGFPVAFRGYFYRCSLVEEMQHETYADYLAACAAAPAALSEEIARDCHRTFPELPFFKDKAMQQSLHRVLLACASRQDGVGYCQGMNYLGGLFLYALQDEFEAYRCFVSLLQKWGLQRLYATDLMPIKSLTFAFERIMEAFLPQLREHFAFVGVRGEAYLLQWLLPVFAADFPISLSLRVLDLLALGGMKRLLQAALALLEAIQEPLLSMGPEEALPFIMAAAAAAPFATSKAKNQQQKTRAAPSGAAPRSHQQKTQQRAPQQAREDRLRQQRKQLPWYRQVSSPRRSCSQEIEMQEKRQHQQNVRTPDSSSELTPGEAWLLRRMLRFHVTNKMIETLERVFSDNKDCRLCIEAGKATATSTAAAAAGPVACVTRWNKVS